MSRASTGGSIPEPRLQRLSSFTPFPFFQCDKMAQGRQFFDIVVVKGTFDLGPGSLEISDEQRPIILGDEPWDVENAERSALKKVGDLHLAKPGTDVYLSGHAHTPTGRPETSWDTAVTVVRGGSPLARHRLRAFGPRKWRHSLVRGWALEPAAPIDQVPIRYELAYGGAYLDRPTTRAEGKNTWKTWPDNPSGSGFTDELVLDTGRAYPGPQWEYSDSPVTALNRPAASAGYGPVARPWTSRLQYAGTYDDAWKEEARRCPGEGRPIDYPADFDSRFFHCATPELRLAAPLRGDEQIRLEGLVRGRADLFFQLPGLEVAASLLPPELDWVDEPLALDTIHVDIDEGKVELTWRLSLDQHRGVTSAVLRWRSLS